MRDRLRWLGPVLLTVVLVTAGCTAPSVTTGSDTPSSTTAGTGTTTAPATIEPPATATPAQETSPESERGSELREQWGIDASLTFDRVEGLLGAEARDPSVVVSADRTEDAPGMYRDPIYTVFGLEESTDDSLKLAGYASESWEVVMNPNLSRAQAESVFAHESVHIIQQQQSETWRPSNDGRWLSAQYPYDGQEVRLLSRSLYEGSAEYVQMIYTQEYVSVGANDTYVSDIYATRKAQQLNASGQEQYVRAPYYYGLSYFMGEVDDPSEVPAQFDSVPMTTEQLLNGQTPAEEPAMPLSVSIAGNESFKTSYYYSKLGTNGELFTRIALDQELDRDRAVAAAAGWGNDSMAGITLDDGESGYLWITRWDTPADADEFESAIEDYGAARPETVTVRDMTIETTFTSERLSADVVAVYIGDESFPDGVSLTADGGNVTIALRD